MTALQRADMARLLLPIMRSTVDSAADDGDALISQFVDGIGRSCASPEIASDPEYVITAAATLAFINDKGLQP